jgi:hypothetical protein
MICKADWLDVKSAVREQRDFDNSTFKNATRSLIEREVLNSYIAVALSNAIAEDRTSRVGAISRDRIRHMLYAYAIWGYPHRRVERSSGQSARLDLFPDQISLREFLRTNLCGEPFRIECLSCVRNAVVEGLLLIGRGSATLTFIDEKLNEIGEIVKDTFIIYVIIGFLLALGNDMIVNIQNEMGAFARFGGGLERYYDEQVERGIWQRLED